MRSKGLGPISLQHPDVVISIHRTERIESRQRGALNLCFIAVICLVYGISARPILEGQLGKGKLVIPDWVAKSRARMQVGLPETVPLAWSTLGVGRHQ